jgi:glycosyltransferase involved in cell wall biosynthesis
MNPPPIVSVLMPVYNGEAYVAQAVESILAQTFMDFEFLITDDGSRDRSLEILQDYASRDSRIRLISRENRGLIPTLNELLEQSQGQFLARMDADDIALPNRLTAQVEFLHAHSDYVCVGGCYDLLDQDGLKIMPVFMPTQNEEIQSFILSGRTIINHPCAMIRRHALQAIGGYDPTMVTVEDLDLLLRLGEVGKLANLNEFVLRYRLHESSVSAKYVTLQQHNARRACERAWKRRGIQGRYDAPIPGYRPGAASQAQYQFRLRYGWAAFEGGCRRKALHNGIKAVLACPLLGEGWKLLACAVLKPLPEALS